MSDPTGPVENQTRRAERSRDFVQSLEKGLAVINSFSRERSTQSVSEVSELIGVSRSTARRILLTLDTLGYANRVGRRFNLTGRILDLGYSSLSSLCLAEIAREPMERLVDELGGSSSMSVLDDTDIVQVAHVSAKRTTTTALGLGSRHPAYPTAMGRVLLAGLSEEALGDYFSKVELKRLTPSTITDRSTLDGVIEEGRAEGFAVVDQEAELGVRSVAAPVVGCHDDVIAAVDVSCLTLDVSLTESRSELLPKLLATVGEINIAARALGVRFT